MSAHMKTGAPVHSTMSDLDAKYNKLRIDIRRAEKRLIDISILTAAFRAQLPALPSEVRTPVEQMLDAYDRMTNRQPNEFSGSNPHQDRGPRDTEPSGVNDGTP